VRIKLLCSPDVAQEHGIRRGRIMEVLSKRPPKGKLRAGYWVMGDAGKPVLVLDNEACVYPEGWE
jgi:hypothetical protein